MHDPSDLRDLLRYELAQRRESGFEIGSLEGAATDALEKAGGPDDERLLVHLERLEASTRRADWPFVEVDDASEQVRLLRSARQAREHPSADDLGDRLLGAWLGRCAGCLLGKPVEGWTAEEIRRYLEHAGAWPLDGYVPAPGSTSRRHSTDEAVMAGGDPRGDRRDGARR